MIREVQIHNAKRKRMENKCMKLTHLINLVSVLYQLLKNIFQVYARSNYVSSILGGVMVE